MFCKNDIVSCEMIVLHLPINYNMECYKAKWRLFINVKSSQ